MGILLSCHLPHDEDARDRDRDVHDRDRDRDRDCRDRGCGRGRGRDDVLRVYAYELYLMQLFLKLTRANDRDYRGCNVHDHGYDAHCRDHDHDDDGHDVPRTYVRGQQPQSRL